MQEKEQDRGRTWAEGVPEGWETACRTLYTVGHLLLTHWMHYDDDARRGTRLDDSFVRYVCSTPLQHYMGMDYGEVFDKYRLICADTGLQARQGNSCDLDTTLWNQIIMVECFECYIQGTRSRSFPDFMEEYRPGVVEPQNSDMKESDRDPGGDPKRFKAKDLTPYYKEPAQKHYGEAPQGAPLKDTYKSFCESIQTFPPPHLVGVNIPTYDQWKNWISKK